MKARFFSDLSGSSVLVTQGFPGAALLEPPPAHHLHLVAVAGLPHHFSLSISSGMYFSAR
jgi:hypothetical protein